MANGTPTALQGPLAQMWRTVYKKAADAAEARLAAQLDEHVYQAHGRRALTIVIEGEASGDGGGEVEDLYVNETGDTMTGILKAPHIEIYADPTSLPWSSSSIGPASPPGGETYLAAIGNPFTYGYVQNFFVYQGGTAHKVAVSEDSGNTLSWHADGLFATDGGGGGGTGNTTMHTQTTAPTGAANSLWFNPSETA